MAEKKESKKKKQLGCTNFKLLEGTATRNLKRKKGKGTTAIYVKNWHIEYEKELKHVAISDVDVTKDLSVAKVYFNTLFPEYQKEALATLKENAPFIRSVLASKIRARKVPELRFFYDESLERGANLESLISKARETDPGFEEE